MAKAGFSAIARRFIPTPRLKASPPTSASTTSCARLPVSACGRSSRRRPQPHSRRGLRPENGHGREEEDVVPHANASSCLVFVATAVAVDGEQRAISSGRGRRLDSQSTRSSSSRAGRRRARRSRQRSVIEPSVVPAQTSSRSVAPTPVIARFSRTEETAVFDRHGRWMIRLTTPRVSVLPGQFEFPARESRCSRHATR